MNKVKVIFKEKKYDYVTSVNPNSTLEEVKKYFIGANLDMGAFDKENMQKCIDIELYDENGNRITK